jgi:predicted metal-dependent phosphoesterase TrpH
MIQNFKIDLHSHSTTSIDGGITKQEYQKLLNEDPSLIIAVTDHNKISLAYDLQQEFGHRIIIGEEIKTSQGEIIGLFLKTEIPRAQSAQETIAQIREQGGLVYVPHPLEHKKRSGLNMETLKSCANQIDIIEVFNARSLEVETRQEVAAFAQQNNIAKVASSDAHGIKGFGHSYSIISEIPTAENLVELLHKAELVKHRPPFVAFLYPAINRFKHKYL